MEKKYPVGSHVLIGHKLGISLGEIINTEEAQKESKNQVCILPGIVVVEWGACISKYMSMFSIEELDEMQERVKERENYKRAIESFHQDLIRDGKVLQLSGTHR
jgi:hypothetical protein